MMRLWLAILVLAVCAIPAAAQDTDADGSKDHPMFSRMPGYYIEDYDEQEFSSFELETDPPRTVEGRYWKISYWVKDGAKKSGPVQIARNYIDLMTRRNGKKLFDDVDASGGKAIAQMPIGGKNIYLQVDVNNRGEVYDLYVIEEAAMAQKVEFTAMELAKTLNDKGSVALHNILFDTGKATLKLEIQGHTDNVGQPAANLKLSQDRAAAVKTYLVQTFGIAAARLTTSGLGETKPVAPNTEETGRAQNRRVELIKK